MWRELGRRGTCIGIGRKARGKEATRKIKMYVVDNIKIKPREIEWGSMDWIDLAKDRDK
jgi:hypothetical protein